MKNKIWRAVLSLLIATSIMLMIAPFNPAEALSISCTIKYFWGIPYVSCSVDYKKHRDGTSDPITEVWFFPDNVSIATTLSPEYTAPDEFGTWTYEYVYECPLGFSRPLGGVKWSTTGPGLDLGSDYEWDASFVAWLQGGSWDTSHDVFTFDSSTNQYTAYSDLSCVPEPSTLFLISCGLIGLVGFLRKI